MAIGLDGVSGFLTLPVAVAGSTPLTFGLRFKPFTVPSDQVLMSLGTEGARPSWEIKLQGSQIWAGAIGPSSSAWAVVATAPTVGSWNSVIGEFANDSSRRCRLNNGAAASNTTAMAVSGVNRVFLGARWITTPGLFFDGHIALPAVWTATLTDAEHLAFHEGVDPMLIRPGSLVFSPELLDAEHLLDRVSRQVLTTAGGVFSVTTPRTFWFSQTSTVQVLADISPPPEPEPEPENPLHTFNAPLSLLTYEKPWMAIPPFAKIPLGRAEKQLSLAGYAGVLWALEAELFGEDTLALGETESFYPGLEIVADTLTLDEDFELTKSLVGADVLALVEAAFRDVEMVDLDTLLLEEAAGVPELTRTGDTLELSDAFEIYGDISCTGVDDYEDRRGV